jgi:oligoendopeptidase F
MNTTWKFKFESPSDPIINQTIERVKNEVKNFVDNFDMGDISPENILKLIESDFSDEITEIYLYLHRNSDIHTDDTDIKKRLGQLNIEWTDVFKPTMVFSDYYKNIGSEKLLEYSNLEVFKEYKNYLTNKSLNLKYDIYDLKLKEFLAEYDKINNSIDGLHNEYRNSFEYFFLGEKISYSDLNKYLESDDERTRKAAFLEKQRVSSRTESQTVLGALYSTVCASNAFNIKELGLENVTHSMALSENINSDLIPNLIANVKKNYPIYHRFLKLKAKLLGKDKLDIWDMFANIKPETYLKNDFSFNEGYKIYRDIINEFDPYFAEQSDILLNNNHIDVYPSITKTSGAYCSSHKHSEVYVLLNWTNSLDDISTLAHELGHATHALLTRKQNKTNADYPLCFAETASIFNETLLMNKYLETADDETRFHYMYTNIDDMFGTIFRQIMFISFETECHTRFLNGETLTYQDYNEIWEKEQNELYGDNVSYPENYKFIGWSMIPHIYNSPFYCYSYAFGNILSLSLYNMYNNSDKTKFVENYKEFLSSGESDTPDNLLKKCFDISYNDENLYNNAFEYIKKILNLLENK